METEIEAPVAPAAPAPTTPPPAAAPEPPRAAAVVIEGKTQAEIDLEASLAKANEALKGHELTVAQLREENHHLRQAQPPTPRASKKKGCIEAFLAGED